MTLYLGGRGNHNDNAELLLNDQLAGMGSAITSLEGSLAWIEAYVISIALNSCLNTVQLLSNQFTPQNISVYADRWASIYGIGVLGNGIIPDNLAQIMLYMSLKEALFGSPPSLAATMQYIGAVLGIVADDGIFIDIEWAPEVQYLATMQPLSHTIWFSPLSVMYVRVWQPRDNQDNLLMPTNVFLNTVDSYKSFVQEWQPAYIAVRNMQLLYTGNNDKNSSTPTYGSGYANGYNVISVSAGGTTVIGTNTTFTADLADVNALGYQMPIEVVDDNNVLQTYLVSHVSTDTHLTISTVAQNNITNRTYRLLGIEMDSLYALDNMLFNS